MNSKISNRMIISSKIYGTLSRPVSFINLIHVFMQSNSLNFQWHMIFSTYPFRMIPVSGPLPAILIGRIDVRCICSISGAGSSDSSSSIITNPTIIFFMCFASNMFQSLFTCYSSSSNSSKSYSSASL